MQKSDAAYQAANLYYRERETMDAIAAHLDVSRPTVSRLLQHARDTGIVQVSLYPPTSTTRGLQMEIASRYNVDPIVVETTRGMGDRDRATRCAIAAARLLERFVVSGTVLGIAWGSTVGFIGQALSHKPVTGSQVVQLNGSANTVDGGFGQPAAILSRFGAAFGSNIVHFPVPAFFDDPTTRDAMWSEQSIRRILQMQSAADVAVFGIGAVSSGVPSPIYTSRYLNDDDRKSLESERVVGDVCTVFLRPDGRHEGIALNSRTSGIQPEALRGVSTRICTVSEPQRATALRAAIQARLVTHVVLDAWTAQALIDLPHQDQSN